MYTPPPPNKCWLGGRATGATPQKRNFGHAMVVNKIHAPWERYFVHNHRPTNREVARLRWALGPRTRHLTDSGGVYTCLLDRSTCRFFFPWPYQPHQCFDCNPERVALMRRLPEDDQFVVPHNLYLTVYSPSSVNVMPFDPLHGSDQARAYATKCDNKIPCYVIALCTPFIYHVRIALA